MPGHVCRRFDALYDDVYRDDALTETNDRDIMICIMYIHTMPFTRFI